MGILGYGFVMWAVRLWPVMQIAAQSVSSCPASVAIIAVVLFSTPGGQ